MYQFQYKRPWYVREDSKLIPEEINTKIYPISHMKIPVSELKVSLVYLDYILLQRCSFGKIGAPYLLLMCSNYN